MNSHQLIKAKKKKREKKKKTKTLTPMLDACDGNHQHNPYVLNLYPLSTNMHSHVRKQK